MKTNGCCFRLFLSAAAVLFSLAQAGIAEEMKPELKSAVHLGGAGDQGVAFGGMGIAVGGEKVYVSGVDRALYGGQALAACYAVPPGSAPLWALRWPNQKTAGSWNEEVFPDVAVTPEGVYFAGWGSWVDTVGDREHKAVLVKFPANGPTGPGRQGSLWAARPLFFPSYSGIEGFMAVTAAEEPGGWFIYATGHAQANWANNTAVVAKYDTKGTLLWSRNLGDTGWERNSYGHGVAALNGHVYVAGYTHYPYTTANGMRATLWKLDAQGNQVWVKASDRGIPNDVWRYMKAAVSDRHLYFVTAVRNGANGGIDALVLKFDEAGNLLWSREWGSVKNELAHDVALAGNRLYVVGETTGWVGGGKDAFLVVMDAEDGKVLSVDHHGGKYDDVAFGVEVAGADLYIVGDTKSAAEGGNLEGQSDLMLLRYTLSAPVPPLDVSIDIRPESFPNPVNPKSKGNIPVAILSTAAFDAPALVDRATLTFGRTGLEKGLPSIKCMKEDVNGDGLLDLLCHFDTQACAFLPGDTRGILMGKTVKGRAFVGSDSVVVVPQTKPPAQSPPPAQVPKGKVKTDHKHSSPVKPPSSEADGLKRGEIGY